MRALLFLDMDGVLNDKTPHPNGYYGVKASCVESLNRVLQSTNAQIVISSAWRYMIPDAMSLQGFEYLLVTHGVDCRDRVVGFTCRDEDLEGRGQQIRHWLNEHGGRRPYVVLDDGGQHPDGSWSDMGIHEAGLAVVWTNGKVGLTAADADRAIRILMGGAHVNH